MILNLSPHIKISGNTKVISDKASAEKDQKNLLIHNATIVLVRIIFLI